MLSVDEVLAGPRGRGLCVAVALSLSETVGRAWEADADDLRQVLPDLDTAPVAGWVGPLAFLEPVDQSVSSAMYWQEPHQVDVTTADPRVLAALRPVAEAVARSPAAAWWDSRLDVTALRYTSRFDDQHPPTPPPLTGAREQLARWRANTTEDERLAATERPDDPRAAWSGRWWSTPSEASLVTTTRSLPGLASIKLAWEEDSFGQDDATIWALTVTREPRVWELDRPRSWTQLVQQYPLEVSHARRHDWYRVTGDTGRWFIPDWAAVAADWDAVHLSVAGYLTTATRALPLPDSDAATVLAGWDPDQTWWLDDILATTRADPETWRNAGDPGSPTSSWQLVHR